MTKQQPEVTRPRPIAELYGENDSEAEPSALTKLKKLGGATLLASGLAFGGLLVGEGHTAPSEKEPISHPIDIFGESSLQVAGTKFKDGRELTYGKDGNNTLRFPDGSEFTHHTDDPVKFGASNLKVEPVEFGKSKLHVVDTPIEFGKSNLRVVPDAASNTERKEK